MRKSLFILYVALALLIVAGSIDSAKNNRRRGDASNDFDDDEFSEFDNSEEESNSRASASKKQSQPETKKQAEPIATATQQDDGFEEIEDEFEEADIKRDQPVKKDDKSSSSSGKQQQPQTSQHGADDLDMEEFEHFVDDEEFENFDGKPAAKSDKPKTKSQAGKSEDSSKMPNLKITNVPTHLLSVNNWHNYVWEIVALVLIAIYFINFIYGKSKNYKFVKAWIGSHYDILEKNFALVGDNGTAVEITPTSPSDPIDLTTKLIKDSDSCYGLWCSGRQSCDGCMIQLKLIKRQDLINGVFMQLLKPQSDQIVISVEYPSQDDIDSFVFCLSQKKAAAQLFNDMQDLNTFCSEKKLLPTNSGSSAGLSIDYKYADFLSSTVASKYVLLNELSEVPNIVMDASLCKFMSKYPEMIEYLLISDQFVGIKTLAGDDQQNSSTAATTPGAETSSTLGIPKSRAILILCLNIPGKGFNTTVEDIESMQPALQLAMYLIDKASRVKLSREAKAKALKKRKEVTEQYLKYTNKQRQEAAQQRKEEKRRAEKDRIMNESDPEKQRRLDEKDQKREKKKSLSKFKQVKIKSM